MARYDEYDITVEVDGSEYECSIKALWAGADYDVGIMSAYIEEWSVEEFTCSGTIVKGVSVTTIPIWPKLEAALQAKVDCLEEPTYDDYEDYDYNYDRDR